nr:hypothetical protein [Ideonella alba]
MPEHDHCMNCAFDRRDLGFDRLGPLRAKGTGAKPGDRVAWPCLNRQNLNLVEIDETTDMAVDRLVKRFFGREQSSGPPLVVAAVEQLLAFAIRAAQGLNDSESSVIDD